MTVPADVRPLPDLPPLHRGILHEMAGSGRPLVRWEGGYWTTEERTTARRRDWPSGYSLPEHFVSIGVVRDLEARGLLRRKGIHAAEWRDVRELTDFGRAVQATLRYQA